MRTAIPLVALAVLLAVPAATTGLAGGAAAGGTANATPVPADGTPYGIETMYRNPDVEETTGGDGVDVAVLDTGVDETHPDLRGNVELCRDYTGERVRYGSCTDENGHGTMVAGTVLADGGPDGDGLYGVAPGADLYAFKVCDAAGNCSTAAMRDAIRGAADAGADVVVMSLGGEPNPHVQQAIEYAHERGVLLIAAAGNSGPDLGTINYPAADRLVMAVGAVGLRTEDGGVTPDNYGVPSFSSRGVDASQFREADDLVEVAAPGSGILSTAPGGGYTSRSGTSFAAPHVGGLAAKLWFDTPDADGDGHRNDDVRARLRDRARSFDVALGEHAGPGYDPAAGLGVPTTPNPAATIAASPGVPLVGETVQLTAGGSVPGDSPIVGYAWDVDGDGAADAEGRTVTTTFDAPGRRSVTVTVRDADGNLDTETRRVLVNDRPRVSVAVPSTLRAGEPVTLRAAVTDEVGSTTVRWRFADGTTASGTSVTREFAAGTPEVTVVVTDEYGANSQVTVRLDVAASEDGDGGGHSGGGTSNGDDSAPVPGFTAPAALLALLLAALVARLRG